MQKLTRTWRNGEIPVRFPSEVLVVGGGVTGVSAAIAAAENGAKVTLVEASGRLGGNFTRSLIGSFNGYTVHDKGDYHMLIRGVGERILERMTRYGGIGEAFSYAKLQLIPYDVPQLERVLDELLDEAGVRVLFRQFVCDVLMDGNRVESVVLDGKAGFYAIPCTVVADASGDGDVATLAGVPSLDDGDGIQFPSTSFYLGGVDIEEARKLTKPRLGEYMKEAVASGKYDLPRVDGTLGLLPNGIVRGNMGRLKIGERAINPLDPEEASFGEREGRRQAFLYLDFIRETIPGYENAFIVALPEQMGVRETRRLRGRYVMTEQDYVDCVKFPDGVALSTHPIERHGSGRTTRWEYLPDGGYVEIPLRCLMPETVPNLMFGGKCVSAESAAQAALRSGASCISMGEAIGVACAQSLEQNGDVGAVDVSRLRKRLSERGVSL